MEIKVVIFKVGNELYGVDIDKVNGIENVRDVVYIPNTTSNIKGIINLRGEVIPLFNLRNKFGYENLNQYTDESRFVIINIGEMSIALEAEEVHNIGEVTEEQIHELPSIITNNKEGFIKNILYIDEKFVAMLEVTELLKDEEKESLKATIEKMKQE